MKGLVFKQWIFEGMCDYIHGGGVETLHIYVPEANHLVIAMYNEELYARTEYEIDSEKDIENPPTIIGEVDVSDELVTCALLFDEKRRQFDEEKKEFGKKNLAAFEKILTAFIPTADKKEP